MGRKTTWIDFLGWSAVYLSDLLVILFRHLWLLCLCSDDVRTWMASLGCRQWLFTPVTCRRLLSFFRYDYTSSLFVPFTAWRGCDWSKNGAATVNEKKKNTWREQGAVCRRLSTCRRVFFGSTCFFFFSLLHTLAWHIWYLWNIWDLSSRFK